MTERYSNFLFLTLSILLGALGVFALKSFLISAFWLGAQATFFIALAPMLISNSGLIAILAIFVIMPFTPGFIIGLMSSAAITAGIHLLHQKFHDIMPWLDKFDINRVPIYGIIIPIALVSLTFVATFAAGALLTSIFLPAAALLLTNTPFSLLVFVGIPLLVSIAGTLTGITTGASVTHLVIKKQLKHVEKDTKNDEAFSVTRDTSELTLENTKNFPPLFSQKPGVIPIAASYLKKREEDSCVDTVPDLGDPSLRLSLDHIIITPQSH